MTDLGLPDTTRLEAPLTRLSAVGDIVFTVLSTVGALTLGLLSSVRELAETPGQGYLMTFFPDQHPGKRPSDKDY